MIKEYGYEYDATLNETVWERTAGNVTYEKLGSAICLRSGRDALKAIAREYEKTTVFMPALACDSMVLPFEMYGHKIKYYRLNPNYSIDVGYLKEILSHESQRVLFLYMDYFGLPAISDMGLESLRKCYPNLVFIEDRTHNLIWDRKNKFQPEYTMASLRKWINVPDGGLLWPRIPLNNNLFASDISFAETRLKAQCMRQRYFCTGDEAIKVEYRKIFSRVSDILDRDKMPSRMSAYAYELVNSTDWNIVRKRRQENAKRLINILSKADVKLIQNDVGKSDLYVAVIIDDRDNKQSKLSTKGIYNTIIWPLRNRQKKVCSVAKYTEEHMLAAPCDQRYTIEDMEIIGEAIKRVMYE